MTRFALVTTLTFGRVPLVLAGCALLFANFFLSSQVLLAAGLALCAASAVTDLFDGMLARRWGVTSRFGALADPLMDKAFFMATLPLAAFGAMWTGDTVHASVLLGLDLLFLFRDQWVSFLRTVCGERGAEVKAALPGKIRTFLAFPGILAVHYRIGMVSVVQGAPTREGAWIPPAAAIYAVEAVLAALTVWTAAYYTRSYAPYLRAAAAPEARQSHAARGEETGK